MSRSIIPIETENPAGLTFAELTAVMRLGVGLTRSTCALRWVRCCRSCRGRPYSHMTDHDLAAIDEYLRGPSRRCRMRRERTETLATKPLTPAL